MCLARISHRRFYHCNVFPSHRLTFSSPLPLSGQGITRRCASILPRLFQSVSLKRVWSGDSLVQVYIYYRGQQPRQERSCVLRSRTHSYEQDSSWRKSRGAAATPSARLPLHQISGLRQSTQGLDFEYVRTRISIRRWLSVEDAMIRPPCRKTVIEILLDTIIPSYKSSVLKHPPTFGGAYFTKHSSQWGFSGKERRAHRDNRRFVSLQEFFELRDL